MSPALLRAARYEGGTLYYTSSLLVNALLILSPSTLGMGRQAPRPLLHYNHQSLLAKIRCSPVHVHITIALPSVHGSKDEV